MTKGFSTDSHVSFSIDSCVYSFTFDVRYEVIFLIRNGWIERNSILTDLETLIVEHIGMTILDFKFYKHVVDIICDNFAILQKHCMDHFKFLTTEPAI